VTDDNALDLATLKQLLQRVVPTIHQAPDDVRYQMNGFLIAVGVHVAPLTALALGAGEAIGPVTARRGTHECTVPFAPDPIRKAQERGTLGKKRKSAKC
jgi:hypothetical protein